MSEELLNKIFDKLVSMETRITNIETNMATKQELAEVKTNIAALETKIDTGFKNTREANDALLELVDKTYHKTEEIASQLDDIADENTFLLKKSAQHDADIRSLRKAL